jgi:hypothetical protein
VAEAIFGLIGVLVGALVTSGWELVMDRRHERKAQKRALRLVTYEIQLLVIHLETVVDHGTAPSNTSPGFRERFMPTEMWEAHRETLADAVSDEVWLSLPVMFQNIELFRRRLLEMEPGEELPDEEIQAIADQGTRMANMYLRLTGSRAATDVHRARGTRPGGEPNA